jgi:hypothetical protein
MPHPEEFKRKRIFVAMPFRAEHQGIFQVLREAANLLGADVVRLDEEHFAGSIVSQIRAEIERSDVLAAIVSEENGNVYYEIGLAHCQRKPVVLLTSDLSALKFDLRDHRAIVYDVASPSVVRDELARTLSSVMNVSADPHEFVDTVLGGPCKSQHSIERRLQKALITIESTPAFGLEPPVHMNTMEVRPTTQEIVLSVKDFMGTEVRAIIDVNGMVGKVRRIAG